MRGLEEADPLAWNKVWHDGEKAEGPVKGLEDANSTNDPECWHEEVGCDLLVLGACVESCKEDGAEGVEAASGEASRNELDVDRVKEGVACQATEHLAMLNTPQREMRQRELEAFAGWLDECQLRLSSLREVELEAWIEGAAISSPEEEMQRDQVKQLWKDIEDLRYELRSLS